MVVTMMMHDDGGGVMHGDATTIMIDNDHTCKKRGIAGIYPRKFFWISRKILG